MTTRRWWREEWIWPAFVLAVMLFLAGELLHGYTSAGLVVGTTPNPYLHIMQYTATWEALPPDYPRPFHRDIDDCKAKGEAHGCERHTQEGR